MAAVVDPSGVKWKVYRRWWPFNLSYIVDFDSVTVTLICALPFVVFWPFWLASKFLGGKWRIITDRANAEVGQELVGGWRRSSARIDELAAEIALGQHSVPS